MHGIGRRLKGLERRKDRERKKERNSYTEFTEGGAQRKTKLEAGVRLCRVRSGSIEERLLTSTSRPIHQNESKG